MNEALHLPPHTFWDTPARGANGQNGILTATAPPDAAWNWHATITTEPSGRTAPTSMLQRLEGSLPPSRLRAALPDGASLLSSSKNWLIAVHRGSLLQVFLLLPSTLQDPIWTVAWEETLRLFIAPSTTLCEPKQWNDGWLTQMGFRTLVCRDHPIWIPDVAHTFSHFLSAGWNLPLTHIGGTLRILPPSYHIPRSHHTEQVRGDSDEILFYWEDAPSVTSKRLQTQTSPNDFGPALAAYRASQQPFTQELVDALLQHPASERGLLEAATIARQHADTKALNQLKTLTARALTSSHGSITLLNAHWLCLDASRDSARANVVLQQLTQMLSRTYDHNGIRDWLKQHLPAWQKACTQPTSHNESSPTQESHHYLLAWEQFTKDRDTNAWTHVRQALAQQERIPNANVAGMLLRLLPQHPEDTTTTALLNAIVQDATDDTNYIRAIQALVEQHDAHGRFQQAETLLQQAQNKHPNSVLLQIAAAQFLTRQGDTRALTAWEQVLQHPELEPFEKLQYQDELHALQQQMGTPATQTAPQASSAPASIIFNALEQLFPPQRHAAPDPSTELDEIQHAIRHAHDSDERADWLGRRATLLLAQGNYNGATQAWTGALICKPQDLAILGGIAATHALHHPNDRQNPSRKAFVDAYQKRAPHNVQQERDTALRALFDHLQ